MTSKEAESSVYGGDLAASKSNDDHDRIEAMVDEDVLRLAQMGYQQDMSRKFSVLSVLGVGFSLTNSWFAISGALITGINSGGPVLIIYGIILVFLVSIGVGITLSELASSMPNAGGQYFWTNELAPPRVANFSSYLTGWISWAGAIMTSAGVSLVVAQALIGCYVLSHPDVVFTKYMVFAGYQVTNVFAFFFNCYGRTLPPIAQFTLYTSLTAFLVIIITTPAVAPTHQNAEFVFATFINNTGWKENGIAYIVGLLNTNWAFACLDCATHLAEEVPRPEKLVPIAIMGTVGIGFVTAWLFGISIFFSVVGDFQNLVNSATGVPILELFFQALKGRSGATTGAIVLECLVIATGIGCLVACHTWQSRLCWSFARDRGVPFPKIFAKVHPVLDVPLNAHILSTVLVAIVGCIYLGSSVALNSMIAASVVLLYVSYSIPVVFLLIKGRNNIPHGPFWMGSMGLISNIVLLVWTAFTFIMYAFPYAQPVTASNMNYVSVVYGVVALIIATDWLVRGRREYRSQAARLEHAESLMAKPAALASLG